MSNEHGYTVGKHWLIVPKDGEELPQETHDVTVVDEKTLSYCAFKEVWREGGLVYEGKDKPE